MSFTSGTVLGGDHQPLSIVSKRGRQRIARAALVAFENLECRRLMSAATWTGGGGAEQNDWTNPANWAGDTVPTAGQDIDFPNSSGQQYVTLNANETVGNITLEGGCEIDVTSSHTLTVNGSITASNENQDSLHDVIFSSNASVTVNATTQLFLYDSQGAQPGVAVTKNGAGELILVSTTDYTGATEISAGSANLNETLDTPIVVEAGTTVDGQYTAPSITSTGGTVDITNNGQPSDITLSDGLSLDSASTFNEAEVQNTSNGTVQNTNKSSLTVTGGTISLGGATLHLSLSSMDLDELFDPDPTPTPSSTAYIPVIGASYTLISNQTGSAVQGTFAGLPEGSAFTTGGATFQITYAGGTSGHDVVLTQVLPTDVWKGAVSSDWSTGGNWVGGVAPTSGQSVEFPDLAGSGLSYLVDLSTAQTVGNITFDGSGYTLSGSNLTVNGAMNNNGTGNEIASNLVLANSSGNTVVTVGTSDTLTLDSATDGTSGAAITLEGGGLLTLKSSGTFSINGTTDVSDGTLDNEGTLGSSILVAAGGTLEGNGSAYGISASGGTISLGDSSNAYSPSTSGGFAFGHLTTVQDSISSASYAGELTVTAGSLNLLETTLDVTAPVGTNPAVGTTFTLISNHTGRAIFGTFANLPEGDSINVNGVTYDISYVGGTSGHDVTLTVAHSSVAPVVPVVPSSPTGTTTPTIAAEPAPIITTSQRPKLSILGADTSTLGEVGLTYDWTVVHAPQGAKPVMFAEDDSNAAKGTTARFQKAGTYHLECVITNSAGNSVTAIESVTVKQIATKLELTPHANTLAAGKTQQYSAVVLDQFNHPMRNDPAVDYSIVSGDATIDAEGLFSAGEMIGHVVIKVTSDDLTGYLGALVN